MSKVSDRYISEGGEDGPLGAPLSEEEDAPGDGRMQHFKGGTICSSPTTGVHVLRGQISDKWRSGKLIHVLGLPTTEESLTADKEGRFNDFSNGSIYSHPKFGTHEIHGPIQQHWAGMQREVGIGDGWQLGYPISDCTVTADKMGACAFFERGCIFWHPAHGAVHVVDSIADKWRDMGYEAGPLGYPLRWADDTRSIQRNAEARAPITYGRAQYFEGGVICSSLLGTHEIHGEIYREWMRLGSLTGEGVDAFRPSPGFPATDETRTSDDAGSFSRFEWGSAIYHHPEVGTYEMYGELLEEWTRLGGSSGTFGFPVASIRNAWGPFIRPGSTWGLDDTSIALFQRGVIARRGDVGFRAAHGPIYAQWLAMAQESGQEPDRFLGVPISNHIGVSPGKVTSYFARGRITWTSEAGARGDVTDTDERESRRGPPDSAQVLLGNGYVDLGYAAAEDSILVEQGEQSGPYDDLMRISLATAPNIGYWKALKIIDRDGAVLANLECSGDWHGPIVFEYNVFHLTGATLVFSKEKEFWRHRDMYWLALIQRGPARPPPGFAGATWPAFEGDRSETLPLWASGIRHLRFTWNRD